MIYVKIPISDRIKTPNSKLFFCEAVFGNCGIFFFFVYFESNSILRPIASLKKETKKAQADMVQSFFFFFQSDSVVG